MMPFKPLSRARIRMLRVWAPVLLLLTPACADRPPQDTQTIRGETMGTFYTVTVAGLPHGMTAAHIRSITDTTLDRVNRLMSIHRDDSELSRFNQHHSLEPFPLSAETLEVLQIAQTVSRESQGKFDITVGPLVNAWGFGPEVFEHPPDEATIAALLEHVGYQKLLVNADGTAQKKHPKLYCDLSAVAKGHAVDLVASALEAAGIRRYMVEVGGEIRVAGRNAQNKPWSLGIEKPVPGLFSELQAIVAMESGAIATSGDYRNFYMHEGQKVSHTIDPESGRPVRHGLASVSVIHPLCAWADAYATAIMAMGPDLGYEFAKQRRLAVLLLLHSSADSFEERATPEFHAYRIR